MVLNQGRICQEDDAEMQGCWLGFRFGASGVDTISGTGGNDAHVADGGSAEEQEGYLRIFNLNGDIQLVWFWFSCLTRQRHTNKASHAPRDAK